ncbi:MAG: outer membrane lipid asymmetry maintenance protein MlaD, partial [Desulfobulbaceae bacterium A2]
YTIQAEFNNIAGIAKGAMIRIAGVDVGRVTSLRLGEDNLALVSLQVDRAVRIPKDSIASVKSQGIIGDKFIQITLGGDEQVFKPGEVLRETESAVDIESLISKFAFGQVK